MKRAATFVGLGLIAALVLAVPLAHAGAGKTHSMTMTVVSVDAKAKMITLKDDKGESHTAPLLGKAVSEAAGLKAGDKVVADCQDSEKGEHQGVMSIKKSK